MWGRLVRMSVAYRTFSYIYAATITKLQILQGCAAIRALVRVVVLSMDCMYPKELPANTYRWANKSVLNGNLIDLMMMKPRRQPIPQEAREKLVTRQFIACVIPNDYEKYDRYRNGVGV